MRILGIESSCDETAAAIVEDGERLISNVVHSQIDIHAQYGGVIPEIAARSHIEVVNPVIERALTEANCTWDDIDAIAVTYAPGLIGSLLVGTLAARTLAVLHDKPLYKIHHVEGHVYANFITGQAVSESAGPTVGSAPDSLGSEGVIFADSRVAPSDVTRSSPDALEVVSFDASGRAPGVDEANSARDEDCLSGASSAITGELASDDPGRTEAASKLATSRRLALPDHQPTFPMLALAVSGKHSELIYFRGHGDFDLLGETQDDAIGEAFDKVAKILGLPYPGGPKISKLALEGDPRKYALPIAHLANPYDFSFSGLKTAVLRAVQREVGVDYRFPSYQLAERLSARQKADFAASFEYIAVKTLVNAAKRAFQEYAPASVVIAGGVAANQALRRQLQAALPLEIQYAPPQLCTDNAAMIATLGYYYAQVKPADDAYDLEVVPSLTLAGANWA